MPKLSTWYKIGLQLTFDIFILGCSIQNEWMCESVK